MELIQQGYYNARVVPQTTDDGKTVYAQFGTAGTGTKQVLVFFQILDGEYAGQRLPWFGAFTQNSWQRTLESLRYCGWKTDHLDNIGVLDQEVQITVGHSEYEGKVNARVDWVNLPGQGGFKLSNPMSEAELRKFSSQMQQRAAQVPVVKTEASTQRQTNTGNGSKAQQQKEPDPWDKGGETQPDDEIPF